MLRSIPPGIRAGNRKRVSLGVDNIKSHNVGSSENFSTKKGKKMPLHQYQRMGIKTLKKLLAKACELKDEMEIAIKVLPNDENMGKFDKLQEVIDRLKQQIESRRQ